MTGSKAIAVLTFKSKEHILSVRGSCSWAVRPDHARSYDYVVCTRNATTRDPEGPESHASAFLVGRLSGVIPSPERPERWLLQFSEYAEISIPNVWAKSWRNPVRYTTLENLGIDLNELKFMPTNERLEALPTSAEPIALDARPIGLTIHDAKKGLAEMFNVPVDAIEITIRG